MVKLVRNYQELDEILLDNYEKGVAITSLSNFVMYRSDYVKIASPMYQWCSYLDYHFFAGMVIVRIIEDTEVSKALYG